MDRDIFKYHNGKETVLGDPIALMRRFVIACGGDYQQRMRDAFPDPYPEAPEANAVIGQATEFLLGAVRRAFELAPWDTRTGSGANDDIAYCTLHEFMDFWVKKKATTENSPTSLTPSDSAGLSSTTTSSADCGPTPSA